MDMRSLRAAAAVLGMLILSGAVQADTIDSALNKAKAEQKLVMLELGSVGCIPCEQMKPVMARLAETYKGKLDVIFVDVKKDQKAARRFGVYMIPVQVFLDRDGREFHRHVGFYAYDEIAPVLKRAGI
jgi:thioredoxin 1